jgi:hypothetical protein
MIERKGEGDVGQRGLCGHHRCFAMLQRLMDIADERERLDN